MLPLGGLALIGIGILIGFLLFNAYPATTSYTIDEANGCTWKNGHVDISTLVAGKQLKLTILSKDNGSFMQIAKNRGICAYPIMPN